MFAIIFWIRWKVKVAKKVNNDKYFETEGVFDIGNNGVTSASMGHPALTCH
jgi:hypothetical protein